MFGAVFFKKSKKMDEVHVESMKIFLESEAQKFVQAYIAQRVAFFKKRKMTVTGELINSMRHEITSALQGAAMTSVSLSFDDSGRYIDMKALKPPPGGSNYIAALEAWVNKKGLAEKFVSKLVERRKLRNPPQNAINMVAWGIATKRLGGVRRRAWYSKSRGGALNDLYNRVAAGMPQIVVDELKKAFAQKN